MESSMKKKRMILLGITFTLMSSVVACESKNKETVIDADKAGVVTEYNTEENTKEAVNEVEVVSNAKNDEAMKLYEKFLANEEVLYFDKVIDSSQEMDFLSFSGIDKSEIKNKPFTLSEMLQLVCESEAKAYWEEMEPKSISYAYIDCGMDGKKELVVSFDDMGENMDSTDLFVISSLEHKLQVVYCDSFGYRSSGEINENGYYIKAGSGGAANSFSEGIYINAEGDVLLDYSYEHIFSVWGLFIPDNYDFEAVAEEQGIGDSIEIERYSFDYTNPGEDYIDYLKRSEWIYYATDENYNQLTGAEYYEEGNPYRIFWDSTGLPLSTQEQLEARIAAHRNEIGMDAEAVNGEMASFTKLNDADFKNLFNWKTEDYHYQSVAQEFTLVNPSWEYYYEGEDNTFSTMVNIYEKSATKNNIIDTDAWFAGIGVEQPAWDSFSDGEYDFYLYGGVTYYPYMMNISSRENNSTLYILDFTEYYESEAYKNGDRFTDEGIGYAKIVDDVLYVSTFHTTYASSESKNAYITAFDMKNNFKVIWKSEPLTCNSKNFEIIDNSIICGYGFTDEDDYVYVLDRSTGKRKNSIRVKTAPEYFYYKNGKLYVRTYDTDYVFGVAF